MTVLDFIRAHFSLDSQVDNLKCATIRKWCLPRRGSSVILIVE